MRLASAQAVEYARYLPGRNPPVVMTCDVGHVFEVWTDFSEDQQGYGGYNAGRRIGLRELLDPETASWFRLLLVDPWQVDPARKAAVVTREVAERLARLARALEADGNPPEQVASFLMRCIFTMFAEDTDLLQDHWNRIG